MKRNILLLIFLSFSIHLMAQKRVKLNKEQSTLIKSANASLALLEDFKDTYHELHLRAVYWAYHVYVDEENAPKLKLLIDQKIPRIKQLMRSHSWEEVELDQVTKWLTKLDAMTSATKEIMKTLDTLEKFENPVNKMSTEDLIEYNIDTGKRGLDKEILNEIDRHRTIISGLLNNRK